MKVFVLPVQFKNYIDSQIFCSDSDALKSFFSSFFVVLKLILNCYFIKFYGTEYVR